MIRILYAYYRSSRAGGPIALPRVELLLKVPGVPTVDRRVLAAPVPHTPAEIQRGAAGSKASTEWKKSAQTD